MCNSHIRAGDMVAVQGIGGLGHLALQYANKMGMRVVAISTSSDKEKLAKALGAHRFIATNDQDPVKELKKLGGADLIVATAPHADAISSVIGGLAIDGELVCIGVISDPVKVAPMQLIQGRKSVAGWPSGTAIDKEDTLKFNVLSDTRPMIETYKFDDMKETYDRMINNKARFRVVLVP